MEHLMYKITIRPFFVFFAFIFVSINDLTAYEKYEEYIDKDNVEESGYCFSRYAFPTTCQDHFSINNGVKHSWMEAESSDVIKLFSDYFHLIPQIYDADCSHCHDC